jgi:hypothetical protein
MAQRIITQLVDDTTGKEIAPGKGETVSFSLDNQSYTIDLTQRNADAFRALFRDYIAVAAKVGRESPRSAKRSRSAQTTDVRVWARANGWPDLGARGRVPAAAKAAFEAR